MNTVEKLRPLKAKIKRKADLSYLDALAVLPPSLREKVNGKVVWAVNELTDMDGAGLPGTKTFIEERGKTLILDMSKVDFETAARRFRQSISGMKQRQKKHETVEVG